MGTGFLRAIEVADIQARLESLEREHQEGCVQDEIIQRILRHSNVGVTQKCYIKTVDADVVAAMRSLENAPNMHLESSATAAQDVKPVTDRAVRAYAN